MQSVDSVSINTIRTLCMDAVQQANSGHPGTPMAMAPVVYVLWQDFLRFDPQDPIWPNRDRFVLSAGHASILLYSLLHLTGVKAVNRKYETLGELAVHAGRFQEFPPTREPVPRPSRVSLDVGSRDNHRPPRPRRRDQRRHRLAERWLASRYNRPDLNMFDFNVYALCRRRMHDGGD